MTARWYRIKPADVEAIQWDPDGIGIDTVLAQLVDWKVQYELQLKRTNRGVESADLEIATASGWQRPDVYDWIVRDPADEQIRLLAESDFTDKYEPKESTP